MFNFNIEIQKLTGISFDRDFKVGEEVAFVHALSSNNEDMFMSWTGLNMRYGRMSVPYTECKIEDLVDSKSFLISWTELVGGWYGHPPTPTEKFEVISKEDTRVVKLSEWLNIKKEIGRIYSSNEKEREKMEKIRRLSQDTKERRTKIKEALLRYEK